MKFPALALILISLLALHANAAVSPVSLAVEPHDSSKRPKGKPGQSSQSNIQQHRSLTIKLTNISSEPVSGLVVKYFFIGHDMKDHKMKVLQHGERKADLPTRKTETVESEEAVNAYTEAHTAMSKSKGNSKGKSGNRSSAKKVAASGQKVMGYAVQVFRGGKLEVAEYSADSFKEIVGTSAPSISEQSADPSKAPKKKAPKKK